ncbi:tRNA lysidine(34) synthetase TilS [Klebsiella pneumoniae subsp. pneumoniae]|nr:tRNA lysidine(34) synthetase TilS [Klebsiella pneumoniae subsp. pneumoniae]
MTADIAHTLHPHRQLLVAFSGGLDSTVLLHQLVLLREQDPSLTLRAVHVHHGLSAHADDWVAHCRQICQQWQVPLVVHRVTLARGGLGVEAHARAARYQAFQDTLNAGEVLVTAQHQGRSVRNPAAGVKTRQRSLPACRRWRHPSAFAGSRLLRPLLNETRESLRQWALAHQLSWIEDGSNQDDTYDRNFLRLRVIPVLRERWPHFSEAVARSASLCAEQEQLLDEMLAAELASLVAEDGSLAIAPLATMSPPRRAALLLRRWLAGQQAPMPAREVP